MDPVNGGIGSDDEVSSNNSPKHKNQYHRNSPDLVAQLEEFFKGNPHPNENERKELGRELRVEPKRIKFWFQNKRNQVKAQIARAENHALREENQKIYLENMMMRERMRCTVCSTCVGLATATKQDDDRKLILRQLLVENAQLKEEWERLVQFVASLPGGPGT
nr:homeobox-leucine zipper protein ROC8-like [Coffea arabica]